MDRASPGYTPYNITQIKPNILNCLSTSNLYAYAGYGSDVNNLIERKKGSAVACETGTITLPLGYEFNETTNYVWIGFVADSNVIISEDSTSETLDWAQNKTGSWETVDNRAYDIDIINKQNSTIYIKFNLSSIPSGSVLEDAKLAIYKAGGIANVNISVYNNTLSNWIEETLTWNKRDTSGTLINYTISDSSTNLFYVWNVTDGTDITKDNISYFVQTTNASYAFRGYSKEYSIVGKRPYLNITYVQGKTTPEENQSKIVNNGPTNSSIYLLMKVQYYDNGTWIDESIIINDTSTRSIPNGETLALDSIWNPVGWYTSTNTHGQGTYRVWVAATDEDDVILKNVDGSDIIATYNFTLNPLDTSNLTELYINTTERIFEFWITNLDDETMNNISWTFNTGESNISSEFNVTLQADKTIFNYIYHNYSSSGNYTVVATAYTDEFSDSESIEIEVVT